MTGSSFWRGGSTRQSGSSALPYSVGSAAPATTASEYGVSQGARRSYGGGPRTSKGANGGYGASQSGRGSQSGWGVSSTGDGNWTQSTSKPAKPYVGRDQHLQSGWEGPSDGLTSQGPRKQKAAFSADEHLKCHKCARVIKESTPFVIDETGKKNYHIECFRCIKCKGEIQDAQYKPTNRGPVCLVCGLPQCAQCENLIVGDLIVAKHVDGTEYSFHTQCLKCVDCGVNITDKYKATKKGFKCAACDSPKCAGCGGQIGGGTQYFLSNSRDNAPICAGCHQREKVGIQVGGGMQVTHQTVLR